MNSRRHPTRVLLAAVAGLAVVTSDPTASPIWHVEGEGRGRPAADWSTAFFLSKRHEVLALHAQSGAVRWRAATGEPGESTNGSAVALAGEVVAAGDYNVVAFDRATGDFRWRFEPDDGYGPGIYLGEAIDTAIFAGSPAGRVYAIDAGAGSARWTTIVEDDGKTTVFPPIADNETVFAAYTSFTAPNTGGVVALDRATGGVRWRAAFPPAADRLTATNAAGGPLLFDDVVIGTRGDGVIHAFDRSDGTIRWVLAGVNLPGRQTVDDFRSLARSGRTLVAGSLTGVVDAYDLTTHEKRWRYSGELNGSIAFALGADERYVYVPYVGGRLVALNIADGTERWRTGNFKSGFVWPPASAGDRIYVAGSGAGFFALRP
jgi:outer membrane protein assembly factor BamB